MDELQAGVELALAVLPQSSVLLQTSEAALYDPAIGHDLESVQVTALAQDASQTFCERFSGIAVVTQQTFALVSGSACSAPRPGVLLCGQLPLPSSPRRHAINPGYPPRCAACPQIPSCPRHSPCDRPCPCSSHSARPQSRACCWRCAPISLGPRQPDFLSARSTRLTPSSSTSLHLATNECTVHHFGKSLGRSRYRQPVRSRYGTAHHTHTDPPWLA